MRERGRERAGSIARGDCRELQGIFVKFRSLGIGHRAVGGPGGLSLSGYLGTQVDTRYRDAHLSTPGVPGLGRAHLR